MLAGLLGSIGQFALGIVQRSYYWLFALLLDPTDLYNRYIRQPAWPEFDLPVSWFWIALALLVSWTAILTYHELRTKHEKPIKADHPDVRAIKHDLMTAASNMAWPAIHALNDAARAGAQFFTTEFGDNIIHELAHDGIIRGVTSNEQLARVTNIDWMRAHHIDLAMEAFKSGSDEYRIARQSLNMLCAALLTKDTFIGKLRDGRGRDMGDIMRAWWSADVRFRRHLSAMAFDPRFARMHASLRDQLTERERFPVSNFTDALAKFWKEED